MTSDPEMPLDSSINFQILHFLKKTLSNFHFKQCEFETMTHRVTAVNLTSLTIQSRPASHNKVIIIIVIIATAVILSTSGW